MTQRCPPPARPFNVVSLVGLACFFALPLFGAVNLIEPAANAQPAFPLVAGGSAAPIAISPDAPEVVRLATRDFADDVARVTGLRPELVDTMPPGNTPHIFVTISSSLAGRWEAFRLSASSNTLVVEGSDRRALAYGLYELSRRIGVSP